MSDFKSEYKSALESVQPNSDALKALAAKMSEQAKLTASNPQKKHSFFYSNLPLKVASIAACAVLVIGAAVMIPIIVSNSNNSDILLKSASTAGGADGAIDETVSEEMLENGLYEFADEAMPGNAIANDAEYTIAAAEADDVISSTAIADATGEEIYETAAAEGTESQIIGFSNAEVARITEYGSLLSKSELTDAFLGKANSIPSDEPNVLDTDALSTSADNIMSLLFIYAYITPTEKCQELNNGENAYIDILYSDDTTLRFYATGYTYDSFRNYISSVFTDDVMLNQNSSKETFSLEAALQGKFYNYNGELFCSGGARGGNLTYNGCIMKLESQTDDMITYTKTAYYHDATDEAYNITDNQLPSGKTESDYDAVTTYTFTLVNTADGWRYSEYSLLY